MPASLLDTDENAGPGPRTGGYGGGGGVGAGPLNNVLLRRAQAV